MANTSKSPATRAKRKSRPLAFPLEFRLRIVKLYLEEGHQPQTAGRAVWDQYPFDPALG